MSVYYGIVKEVYINDIDVMNSKKIGFKIEVDNKIICVEQEQNLENADILKGDKVRIIKQVIDNIEFIDIEKIEGDIDELL